MATFDVAQPTDVSKIRNGPSLIRENFEAIAEGDQSFTQRRLNLIATTNPADVTDQIRIFGHDDSVNVCQVWIKDEQGNRYQITQDGQLGCVNTGLLASAISFDNTVFYDANNFVVARCSVGTGGGSTSSSGIDSATNDSTGVYTVTISTGLIDTNGSYQILVTPFTSGGVPYFACIADKPGGNVATPTEIVINIFDVDGDLANRAFQFIAIGGV